MLRRLVVGLLSPLLLCLVAIPAFSDGLIVPDRPELGWLSVVYHDVTVTIRDGVVTTHIDQVFQNGTGYPIEGRYLFPLPPGAVVSGFAIWVDGVALEAEVLDADQARDIYEDSVRRAIDPALLEYVGRDTLSARIFPIPAGDERRIEITYSELLAAESGTYRYRYPLDTERYSAQPLERVTIRLDIETSSPLSAVYSPTHPLTIQRPTALSATAVYEESEVLPTVDFLLYYAVSDESLGMTLLTYNAPDDDGYFLLIATPAAASDPQTVIPKDLIFVLDQSGSMMGDKIEQAKQALLFVLDNLNGEDRFAIVSFSDSSRTLTDGLTPVSAEALAAAKARVSTVDADGGTNIDQALAVALALFEPGGRPQFLIFLTDGEPTVGVQDPFAIVEDADAANLTGARIFSFGVGYDVNTLLLDRLAEENRGTTTYVLPGENLEARLSSFYRKIASPALADTQIDFGGVDAFDVFPRTLPDVFHGTQLLVLGRYRTDTDLDATVTVSGSIEGLPASFTSQQTFLSAALDASFLPRLWAGRKIAYLLDQIRLYGESSELVDQVIDLSRRYGIITPYTSFLVDESSDLDTEEMAGAVVQAAAPTVGASAVSGASALKTLAESETVQTGVEQVRVIGDHTYFFRNDTWIDSEYADEETIDIAAYSDAYFDLLTRFPGIGPHLSLGDRVVFQLGDDYVRIGEQGLTTLTQEVIDRLLD